MSAADTPRNLHDRVFKALFSPETAWPVLRAALPKALAEAVDPDSFARGPETLVNDELEEDHRDLVLSARVGGEAVLFYVVEHQSQPDPFMPLRLLRYVLKVWQWWRAEHPQARELPAVIPVVLHQSDQPWKGPRSLSDLIDLAPELQEQLGDYLPRLQMGLLDLGATTTKRLAQFPGPPATRVTLTLMRAVRDRSRSPLEAVREVREAIVQLVETPKGRRLLTVALRYTVLARPEVDVEAVRGELDAITGEEGAIEVTTVQEYMDQGAVLALRETLVELLVEKFGALSPEDRERLEQAELKDLQRWVKRLLSAERVEEVFG